MVRVIKQNDPKGEQVPYGAGKKLYPHTKIFGVGVYQCEECGFHYEDKKQAEKCEAWCKEHHSCNIEITAQALENRLVPE